MRSGGRRAVLLIGGLVFVAGGCGAVRSAIDVNQPGPTTTACIPLPPDGPGATGPPESVDRQAIINYWTPERMAEAGHETLPPGETTTTRTFPPYCPPSGPQVSYSATITTAVPPRGGTARAPQSPESTSTTGSDNPATAGYGGALIVTFTQEASPTDRTDVLATCGRLPGVSSYAMTAQGTGTMTIPPAGEIGANNAVKAQHQAERQRIYACVKASPLVASTVEGL